MAILSRGNVIMGPAAVYMGASGVITAAPTDAAVNSTPAASAWTDLGGTFGGVTLDITPKFTSLNLDQELDDIDDRMTSRVIMVTINFGEATLSNLALATNSTVGATGANYATLDAVHGPFAGQTTKFSLLVDGFAPTQNDTVPNARRRLYVPRCQQIGPLKIDYARDKQVNFAAQLKAYFVSNSTAPYHITDQTA